MSLSQYSHNLQSRNSTARNFYTCAFGYMYKNFHICEAGNKSNKCSSTEGTEKLLYSCLRISYNQKKKSQTTATCNNMDESKKTLTKSPNIT